MKRLTGVNTLLMTPFTQSNEIDLPGIFRQIDRVLQAGASSVVVQGKIGEYDTYTMAERRDTARAVVDYVNGGAPVGVGIINAKYDDGLDIARAVRDAGADYVMSRPPIDGDTHDYFLRLADIAPVMLYDQGLRGELSIRDDIPPPHSTDRKYRRPQDQRHPRQELRSQATPRHPHPLRLGPDESAGVPHGRGRRDLRQRDPRPRTRGQALYPREGRAMG